MPRKSGIPSLEPYERVFLVTPNDGADLTNQTRGISFATAGALKITDSVGNTVVIPSGALAAGVIHFIRAKRIWSTGTTAASIVGYE